MTLLPAMNASGAGRHGWAQINSANQYRIDGGVCVCARACVCVIACVRACVLACLRACVRAFVRARAGVRDVFPMYDNNI